MPRDKVFVSYSHTDKSFLDELLPVLQAVQPAISGWMQGHLVFGWELHTGAKKSKRVLFRMGSCLPGTPRMSQNPLLR